MRNPKQELQKICRRLFVRSELHSCYRQQAKFRKRYPKYELGVGTYGMPIVHDWGEGTTLRIGAYCSIAGNVQIFLGEVIASGAVVSRDVESYAVMAGNPAQRIRWRFDEPTRTALLASAWWEWPEEEIRQVVNKLCSDDIVEFINYVHSRNTQ